MIFSFAARRFLLLPAFVLSAALQAAGADTSLSLADATDRVLANNPELQLFQLRQRAIDGQRQTAALAPAYAVGITAENALGSGDYSGADSAELTLSLASVLELGERRDARLSVADSRYALAQAEREVRALDLLGEITQRFIATLSLQQQLDVAREATQLAERSLQLVKQRVDSGAAPEAEQLRAEATLIQARLQQSALNAQFSSRRLELATLWGADKADFLQLDGDLFRFAPTVDFDTLYQRTASTPALAVYASEARLRDAEVTLARAQSASSVQWNVGVRRFEATSDTALVAGVSVPLFAGDRSKGELQSALAEREAVDVSRDIALRRLRARLHEAWQSHRQAVTAANGMRRDLLPALARAEQQTRDAYEHGRYGYAEWLSAQRDLLDARRTAIDIATTARMNQALLEQLTAAPLELPQ